MRTMASIVLLSCLFLPVFAQTELIVSNGYQGRMDFTISVHLHDGQAVPLVDASTGQPDEGTISARLLGETSAHFFADDIVGQTVNIRFGMPGVDAVISEQVSVSETTVIQIVMKQGANRGPFYGYRVNLTDDLTEFFLCRSNELIAKLVKRGRSA